MSGIRRRRRSSEGWRALLTRFACSGQTVTAFFANKAAMALAPALGACSAGDKPDRPRGPRDRIAGMG